MKIHIVPRIVALVSAQAFAIAHVLTRAVPVFTPAHGVQASKAVFKDHALIYF